MQIYINAYFRTVSLYSNCMCRSQSQYIRSGVVPPLDSKLLI